MTCLILLPVLDAVVAEATWTIETIIGNTSTADFTIIMSETVTQTNLTYITQNIVRIMLELGPFFRNTMLTCSAYLQGSENSPLEGGISDPGSSVVTINING